MENKSFGKFTDMIEQIYDDLKPALKGLALRYHAPNPDAAVREWMSNMYDIVNRFDNGRLQPKVYTSTENQDEMTEYNPSRHKDEEFLRSLKNYLKKSFLNDLIKNYNNRQRKQSAEIKAAKENCSEFSRTGFAEGNANLFKYDVITLETVTNLIKKDWEKSTEASLCVLDAMFERFLRALTQVCTDMCERGSEWRTMAVVSDIDEKDNKKFFSYDFRCELESGVRQYLLKIIIEEENPIIADRLLKLADPKNKAALQKRLFRYLYEHKNGLPARLRTRVKHKEL